MRYLKQFNILVTGSRNNKNITIWSLPDINELNKAYTKYGILKLEIMSESKDRFDIITGDNKGYVNILKIMKINENGNKFRIDLLTQF